MQLLKAKTAAIVLVLLMASAALMVMPVQPVKAQIAATQPTAGPLPAGVTPFITITTDPYLSFTPNPVGVGQTFLVNMWLHPPIHVQRQFIKAFVVTITKPDGTKDTVTLDSYCGDSTAWFEYIADQVGTWKLKFEFIGMYFPTGRYYMGYIVTNTSGTALDSAYYKPSSTAELTLTVQEAQVLSWPPSPLPTDYWTRPVSPMNREWWQILGHWPETGVVGGGSDWPADTNTYMSNYNFVPYVQGPNTAHIVWKRQNNIGGIVGGEARQVSITLGGITGTGWPTIIYAGRCYEVFTEPPQTIYINGTWQYATTVSSVSMWRCYDLRTGELYWKRPLASGESAPTIVEYHKQGFEVPGAIARAGVTPYLTAIIAPTTTASGRLIKYDPWTGAVAINVTGAPTGVTAGTLYAYPYALSVQDLGSALPAAQRYRLINWTIENNAGQWVAAGGGAVSTVDNFTARIMNNITWPFSSLGTVDYESEITVVTGSVSSNGTGVGIGQFIQAASLRTGALLWNITTDLSTGYETFFSGSTGTADHGKYAVRMQNGQIYCWDLYSGKIAWKSQLSAWPWGVFGAYSVQSAYGLYYSNDYDGVHAINWTNGNIEWTFKAPTPYQYETPYQGYYSWHSAGKVADGKLYTFNTEHTPTQPITRGWRFFCLNATTGECIWSLLKGEGIPGSRYFVGAIADGYLAFNNDYDQYLYVIGKGKSQTTVTAPDVAVPKGTGITIKGTVLDMSPAQPGTPCVSKDSMTTQMEYLHMQQPIDGIWHNATITGVPVTLTAIRSDGSVIDIGAVTTNGYYGTFSYAWTPPDEGTYTITASFAGDDSYGSSSAATAVTVGPAPEPYPEPIQPEPPDNTPIFNSIIAATIAIIIAVAIATILLLRKRP